MAQTSTIYNFEIDLADGDRGVYEHLELRVARHPSESEDYLVTRVLAYCLEYADGITFSKGISEPDEPTIAVRDPTGALEVWIEIGAPDAARVHKAGKAASRVVVYSHKDPTQMLRLWAKEHTHRGIHRFGAIELYRIDRALLDAMVSALERRMTFSIAITDRDLYVAIGEQTIEGRVTRISHDA